MDDFMMSLGKPQRRAKFEVAGFICYLNIREFLFKIFGAKYLKGTPLRQIWSNKSFGVLANSGALTLYRGENAQWKLESRVV